MKIHGKFVPREIVEGVERYALTNVGYQTGNVAKEARRLINEAGAKDHANNGFAIAERVMRTLRNGNKINFVRVGRECIWSPVAGEERHG